MIKEVIRYLILNSLMSGFADTLINIPNVFKKCKVNIIFHEIFHGI